MAGEGKGSLLERFPALRRLRGGRRWRIPEVRQMTATDCGAACLAMVLAYHGRDMSLDEVRAKLGSARDGTTARAILDAARSLGLRGRGVSIDLDRLSYLPPGTVLHWRFAHFVVFEKLGKGFVQLVDPEMGRRRVSMEQFSHYFTGVALLLEPAEDFQTGSSRRKDFRYLVPVLRQAGTLRRVLLMSAVLQLLLLAVPLMTGMVVDRVVPRRDYHLLAVLVAALAAIGVFQFLSSLVRGHLLLVLRARLDSWMTLGFLDHLVDLAYPFFQLRPAGDLVMRLNLQSKLRELLSSSVLSGVLDGSLVLVYLVVIFTGDPLMGLLVLLLGVLQVLCFLVPRARQRSLMSQNLELEARNQSYQISILTGMQTLKAFGAEQRIVQGYSNLFVDLLNVSLESGRVTVWVDSLMGGLRMVAPMALLGVGAYRVVEGGMTLGEMLSLNALAAALLTPLSNLVGTGTQLQFLGNYLERINDVMDTPPERPPERAGVQVELKGAVTLEGVSFRYAPNAPLAVRDVSIQIEPGKMVAIVGRSGSGKSTLANLMLGLYLPTAGRVLYDGRNLEDLDLRSVRGQVGVVLQESFFLGATLKENIVLSDPELTLERVVEAAQLAQVHEEIARMPMQYETMLADRGLSLSGGQRQRLALARALVRKPALLLLDEATSALDAVAESRVHAALEGLKCTRVIIAHRLSTVRKADVILVMDAGQVVEQGTHEELLDRRGIYAQLVHAQLEQGGPAARVLAAS